MALDIQVNQCLNLLIIFKLKYIFVEYLNLYTIWLLDQSNMFIRVKYNVLCQDSDMSDK